tara:strand:- start:569 stop:796 length:228 start_codon:yes stop_codon:yes gene_type:complete
MINTKEPHLLEIKKDKNYAWCQCSESEGQPFCDGSHKKTDYKPIVFKSDISKEVALCGCKQSKNAPYCDGTHLTL